MRRRGNVTTLPFCWEASGSKRKAGYGCLQLLSPRFGGRYNPTLGSSSTRHQTDRVLPNSALSRKAEPSACTCSRFRALDVCVCVSAFREPRIVFVGFRGNQIKRPQRSACGNWRSNRFAQQIAGPITCIGCFRSPFYFVPASLPK